MIKYSISQALSFDTNNEGVVKNVLKPSFYSNGHLGPILIKYSKEHSPPIHLSNKKKSVLSIVSYDATDRQTNTSNLWYKQTMR